MKCLKLICFLLFATLLHAQSDSVVRYWIFNKASQFADIETNNPVYASTREVYHQKDGLWKMESYFISNGQIYMTGAYSDEKGTKREGEFKWYYQNGILGGKDFYISNKHEGLYQTWYENGTHKDSFVMKGSVVTGKGYTWNKDGVVTAIYNLDKEGSGTVKFFDNKGMLYSEGKYLKGKKEGVWNYYTDETYKNWEVIYERDSVLSYSCLNKNGTRQADCIFETEAAPTGGATAWRNYLQKAIAKYNYPSRKLVKSKTILSGDVSVRFLVDKDGSIIEVQIVKSLNEEADNIVLNVIHDAPKWIPGIYMNKPIRSYHTQPITFKVP